MNAPFPPEPIAFFLAASSASSSARSATRIAASRTARSASVCWALEVIAARRAARAASRSEREGPPDDEEERVDEEEIWGRRGEGGRRAELFPFEGPVSRRSRSSLLSLREKSGERLLLFLLGRSVSLPQEPLTGRSSWRPLSRARGGGVRERLRALRR